MATIRAGASLESSMRIISNQAPERVADYLSHSAAEAASVSVVASHASLFGLEALNGSLPDTSTLRLLLPGAGNVCPSILGRWWQVEASDTLGTNKASRSI
jgi:hypothetical protein